MSVEAAIAVSANRAGPAAREGTAEGAADVDATLEAE